MGRIVRRHGGHCIQEVFNFLLLLNSHRFQKQVEGSDISSVAFDLQHQLLIYQLFLALKDDLLKTRGTPDPLDR